MDWLVVSVSDNERDGGRWYDVEWYSMRVWPILANMGECGRWGGWMWKVDVWNAALSSMTLSLTLSNTNSTRIVLIVVFHTTGAGCTLV